MRLSDRFLFDYFGIGKESTTQINQDCFSFALQPYLNVEEYFKDRNLLQEYNNSCKTQDVFLIIHAARVERTDPDVWAKIQARLELERKG